MPWYSKRFADGRIGLSQQSGLEAFKEVFDVFAQRHLGAEMFFRIEQDGSATVYLTPASTEFAAMIRATELAGEPPADTLLLVEQRFGRRAFLECLIDPRKLLTLYNYVAEDATAKGAVLRRWSPQLLTRLSGDSSR